MSNLHVGAFATVDLGISNDFHLCILAVRIDLGILSDVLDDLRDHSVEAQMRDLHQAFCLGQVAVRIDIDDDILEPPSTSPHSQLTVILPFDVNHDPPGSFLADAEIASGPPSAPVVHRARQPLEP